MSAPCGDITCYCCYPQLQCHHPHRPREADPGTVHRCPECESIWTATPFGESPSAARLTPILARHKLPIPRTIWRRLAAGTRLPGSAPWP